MKKTKEVSMAIIVAFAMVLLEGTGKSGSYGMWNHPRGHVWNVS